jgi:hypothetical protein
MCTVSFASGEVNSQGWITCVIKSARTCVE